MHLIASRCVRGGIPVCDQILDRPQQVLFCYDQDAVVIKAANGILWRGMLETAMRGCIAPAAGPW